MEERAVWAVDERRRLFELEVAHVALAELDVDARLLPTCAPEPSMARDESIPSTRLPVSRATGIATRLFNRQLDDRPIGLARELDAMGDVLDHRRRPLS